jgi:hypothetical protein
MLIKFISVSGWIGVLLGTIAVITKQPAGFLAWQLVANISGFAYSIFLQRRVSPDTILSLLFTVFASVTQDVNIAYAAMLVRSISYQLVFNRQVQMLCGEGHTVSSISKV